MTKKKIILAATTDLNYDQRLIRISSSLTDMGFDVLLVGRILPTSPPLRARKYQQYRLSCFFHKGALFYAEYNIRLFFFLLFKKANFFTANDLDSIIGVYFSSIFKRSILVFDAHELFTEVPELHNSSKKKIWTFIEKFFVSKFQRHYTVCQSLANIFEEKLQRKFKVIRNVPYLQKENTVIDKNEKFILYQGALNEGRGLEELLHCIKELPYKLKIAGSGDLDEKLREITHQLEIKDKVEFLGKLTPKALQELTPKAYIGYHLLDENNIHYYYSLGNKFFEYTNAEIPFLVMDFPEYNLAQEQYQVALKIKSLQDKDAIKKAITTLFEEEETYIQLKENTKQLKQILNWENEAKELASIYK
ncbi:MAG: glycosyltransferase [Chitinophagales bacterium]